VNTLNKKRNILIFVFFLILIFVLNFKYIMIKYAYFFTVNQYEAGADAIVVLSGSPSTRISMAFDLTEQKFSNRILLTDTMPLNKNFGFKLSDSLDISKKIRDARNSNEDILKVPSLTGGAKSTFDEAKDIFRFSKEQDYNHIIILTDFYHTRRALLAFNKIFKGSNIRIDSAAAYNDIFNEKDWWESDLGISTYIIEPIKLIVYFFTSGNSKYIKNY
tara:strand:- start:262 stop:915 length:654 start_codon:yes stop_codon:yes gene_type:complete